MEQGARSPVEAASKTMRRVTKDMGGTKQGAAVNPWIQAQRECARLYNEGKQAAKDKEAKEAKECACKAKSKAEKTREVDGEVRKERAAAKARHAQHTKALRDDDTRVKQAIRKTEEPARKAQRAKLAAHAQESQKAMEDQATAKALATVARRRLAAKTPDPARR